MIPIAGADPLATALNVGRVTRKANNARKLRARAGRVSSGSAEVMVKVTGFTKGASHFASHLSYLSRNGKLELETDRGEILRDREDLKALAKDWSEEFNDGRRRRDQRDAMRLVLSMPEGTPDSAVREGARAFAKRAFADHDYVFVLHTDQPHPHVHLTVKMEGRDGERINPRKDDLRQWRESFAEKMRDEGIDAEATPRAVRGKVQKAERQVVRHIERGDLTHPPRVAKVRAAQVREAAREMVAEAAGTPAPARPWEPKIKTRQAATRDAWLRAAVELAQPGRERTAAPNVRPDYERIDPVAARAGQRAAALYQSGHQRAGRQAPAAAVTRMRDMSGRDLVHDQRPAQVFLLADAPRGVGRHGHADRAVRWEGPGLDHLARQSRRVIDRGSLPTDPHGLSQRIVAFVRAMPPITTVREERKHVLAQQFVRGSASAEQAADASRGSPRAGPSERDRDR